MNPITYIPAYLGLWVSLVVAALAAYRVDLFGPRFLLALIFWGVVFGVGLAGGRAVGRGARWPRHVGRVLMGISILATVLAFTSSNLETTLVIFLLSMQAARNFTLHSRREFYFACCISFILFFEGMNGPAGAGYFVYVVTYVLAILFTFIAEYVDSRIAVARGGDRDALMGRFAFPFALLSSAFAVMVIGVAIWMLTPRFTSPQAELFPSDGGFNTPKRQVSQARNKVPGSGRPERGSVVVTPGRIPNSIFSNSPYRGFSAQFEVDQPWDGRQRSSSAMGKEVVSWRSTHQGNLRARTFDQFDGRGWRNSSTAALQEPPDVEPRISRSEPGPNAESGAQSILTHQSLSDVIPAGPGATELEYMQQSIDAGADGTFQSGTRIAGGSAYRVRFTFELADDDLHPIGDFSLTGASQSRYYQLPQDMDRRISALSKQLVKGLSGEMNRAQTIEHYLRTHYTVTVGQSEAPSDTDGVATFLFDSKLGHSELFATSMVLMLRSVKIPARLVTGFSNPSCDAFSGECEATFSDAHAWVEAFVPGKGWVSFEPTPSYDVASSVRTRTMLGAAMEQLRRKVRTDRLLGKQDWTTTVSVSIVNTWDTLRDLWRKLLRKITKLGRLIWSTLKYHGLWTTTIALSCAAAIYAAVLIARSKVFALMLERCRIWRAQRRGPQAVVFVSYAAMGRLFSRLGWNRHFSWTPHEYERQLGAQVPVLRASIASLTELFALACYSDKQINSEHARLAVEAYEVVARAIHDMRAIELIGGRQWLSISPGLSPSSKSE
jgi:hypothetical protein